MTSTPKNISLKEFKNALEIVTTYHKQFETSNTGAPVPEGRRVNLEGKITNSMFKVLVLYYKNEYDIDLQLSDLRCMYVNLLAAIDYDKMANYRGLGAIGIEKFKELLQLHSVTK